MFCCRRYRRAQTRRRGFSLVELVIVVVILGIVTSIAVPRMTSASTKASASALRATLSHVRTAIDCYYAEHDRYPGYDPSSGTASHDDFVKQLTLYSDAFGKTSQTPSTTYAYGPYLRPPFPENPANGLSTVYVKETPSDADPAAGSYGWVAVLSHGYFGISATTEELEALGVTGQEDQKAAQAKVGS